MPVENQVAVIYAVTNGYLDEVPVERVRAGSTDSTSTFVGSEGEFSRILETIRDPKGSHRRGLTQALVAAVKEYNEVFQAQQGPSGRPETAPANRHTEGERARWRSHAR
jgi:F-type H+/Na+-transporting ATPase subunit alpha